MQPDHDVSYELLRLGRHMSQLIGQSGGLDRSAFILLARMEASGPMTVGELSEALGLDPSTLNRQTATLVRQGLAERIPDPDGGPARRLRTTPQGHRRLIAEHEANRLAARRVMSDWSEDEMATLAALLRRFNGNVDQLTGRSWPRPEVSDQG